MSGFWCGRSYSVRSRSGRGESDLRGGPFARTLSGIHAKHNGAILRGYIRSGSVSDFGGAGLGGPATGELVNTIALAIQAHVAAADIVTMQFCRQPASQPATPYSVLASLSCGHRRFLAPAYSCAFRAVGVASASTANSRGLGWRAPMRR